MEARIQTARGEDQTFVFVVLSLTFDRSFIILLKTSIHRFKTRERKKKKKSVSSLQAVDCLRNKMDKENNYPFYN